MSTPSLPISTIIPVSVVLAPVGATGPTFNQALVVGSSSSSITVAQRLQQVTGLSGLTALGYSTTSPEYIWSELYFGQTPAPTYLWVGIQVLTALQTTAIGASAGTGYAVGDIVTVSGGTGGTLKVITLGGSGSVATYSILTQGYGYSIATNSATTGGSGSGFEVNITAIGETPTQAITACRLLSPSWYICSFVGPSGISVVEATGTASSGSTALTVGSGASLAVGQLVVGAGLASGTTLASGSGTSWVLSLPTTGALVSENIVFYAAFADSDKEAIAAYVEAATPPSVYFLTSGEAAVLNNAANNLFSTLQAESYNRTLGIYTTTQSGAYPNNPHASGDLAGYAMGSNTWAAASYFALAYKRLVGISTEPLSQSQALTIAGAADRSSAGNGGNVYINLANGEFLVFEFGQMFSGRFFDVTLFLDMLSSQVQINAMNLLVSQPSVPLTNAGITQMINAVTQACVQLQTIGFIANTGVWAGVTIGPYSAGTSLPKGYAVYMPNINTLTQAQRAARQFPPMNVLIILAESGQSLAVSINVQY